MVTKNTCSATERALTPGTLATSTPALVAASIGIMSRPAPCRIAARSFGASSNRAGGSGARTMTMSAVAAFFGQRRGIERRGDPELARRRQHLGGARMQRVGRIDDGHRQAFSSVGARRLAVRLADQALPVALRALQMRAHQRLREVAVAAQQRLEYLQVLGMRSAAALGVAEIDRQPLLAHHVVDAADLVEDAVLAWRARSPGGSRGPRAPALRRPRAAPPRLSGSRAAARNSPRWRASRRARPP